MALTTENSSGSLIQDVGASADDAASADGAPLQQLESLCMRCEEQGTTRILMTRIPNFREILLMAFECPHCGEKNNEVQFAGSLQLQGCRISLTVAVGEVGILDRQVVKADTARILIPELDFEIPREAQRGSLSTVEGVLCRAREELAALQDQRRAQDPETAGKIDVFLGKLEECATGKRPFTLVLDDPAGNSFIQNPNAPAADPLLKVEHYERTPEQNEELGFLPGASNEAGGSLETAPEEQGRDRTTGRPADLTFSSNQYVPAGTTRQPHGSVGAQLAHRSIVAGSSAEASDALLRYSAPEEVMVFPASCSACSCPCETRMYVTDIPYFKEVIVMATSCDSCGYKNSELKPGGGTSAKAKRVALLVKSAKDLTRDVIKSDTASVAIPELELELASGTLGGKVTTVEGLVDAIREALKRVKGFEFGGGDSSGVEEKRKWTEFDGRLEGLTQPGFEPWHLIVDDALANSFIAPATDAGLEKDEQVAWEEYERSWDQNEELGLNDMDTEGGGDKGAKLEKVEEGEEEKAVSGAEAEH